MFPICAGNWSLSLSCLAELFSRCISLNIPESGGGGSGFQRALPKPGAGVGRRPEHPLELPVCNEWESRCGNPGAEVLFQDGDRRSKCPGQQEGRSCPGPARPGAAAGRVPVRPLPLPATSWFAEGGGAAAGRVAGTERRGRGRGRRRRGAVPARPRRAPWAGRGSEQRVPDGVRACGRGATVAPQRHVTMDRRTR